jgi:hypothetical protein
MERDAVVVELAVQERAGVFEEGLGVAFVEDGVGPAPVAVRAQEG